MMDNKLKPYQVGENDIVAAHSKGEAAQEEINHTFNTNPLL